MKCSGLNLNFFKSLTGYLVGFIAFSHNVLVPVDVYQAPYQINVGPKPSVQDMHEIVVAKKIRPPLKTAWERHSVSCKIFIYLAVYSNI